MDYRQFPPEGPGKTPPRLINDLLDYDPRTQFRRNLLADPAPIFKKDHFVLRKGEADCRHSLMKKEHRTTAPISNDEQPNGQKYVIAAYCTNCRFHFDITADFSIRPDFQNPCRLSDEGSPMHHLRLVESMYAEDKHDLDKYNEFTESHRWVCSGPTCPLVLEIKITPPRLKPKMLNQITNADKVDARGRKVIAAEPERYAGYNPLTPLMVLGNLRSYLADAKAARDKSELKRIAKRNKRFGLGFADDCDSIFNYLDFTQIKDEGSEIDAEPSYFWQLPVVSDINKDFIDDVITEINILIASRPPGEDGLLTSKIRPTSIPLPALKDIERSLGYHDYPTKSRMVDLSEEEHPHYASLGAVGNFTDTLLMWVYDRQCDCDPQNKPYYLDCLSGIAAGRKSPDLETKVVLATSAGEFGLEEIQEAYKFFTLDATTKELDDHIIGLYRSRIDSAPRQKDEARQCLRVIAKHRASQKIQAVVNDKTMDYNEALEFLGVTEETASDSIEAVAIARATEEDKTRVAAALRVVAKHRVGDFTLQRAAAAMESDSGESTLDISEAYNRLQITERNAPDETVLAYYESLSSGAPAGSKDSYAEALRAIGIDRHSSFLLRKLDDPDADVQAEHSTADEPVGLENIGNTCYLNSLLQYYYTVKAVREVVMNIDKYRMDINDPDFEEAIKKKRVGETDITRVEVIKAQKFVDELHSLFEELRTASTKSVKPTKALAELTIFSTNATLAWERKKSISSPSAPNLSLIMNTDASIESRFPSPPPSSHPSVILVEEDVEMIDHPGNKISDGDDESSEATLVDATTRPSTPPPSYDHVTGDMNNDLSITETSQQASLNGQGGIIDDDNDAVMVNGGNHITISVPDKPPPVPPRNKSGLSIQTTSKEIISEDELWKFGSQQDVTEIISNVLHRLRSAIKANSIDEISGDQIDNIRDVFYGATSTSTQKARALERKIETWAEIIAFPPLTGSHDIYEALDVSFDVQQVYVEDSLTPQYTSIHKLPPILQIQIQRTAYDQVNSVPFKNKNPVTFPETIYLDRYMDSDDPKTMRRREEAWEWKAQIRALEARQKVLKATEADITLPDALHAAKDFINQIQENEIDGIEIDPALPEALDDRFSEVKVELDKIEAEIANLKHRLAKQFVDMREHEYNLQTVFIHRGESGGGHYWIYIYDFKNDIWREYNDERVTEVVDRKRIFEHSSQAGGTPYYLAYVRAADKDDLVDAVYRDVKEVEMTDVTGAWVDGTDGVEDEGIGMDEEEEGGTRHIEHARPRPLLPKPTVAQNAAAGGAWGQDWDSITPSRVDANGKPWS